MTYNLFLNTTASIFSKWLEDYTQDSPLKRYPTDKGYIILDKARPSQHGGNYLVMTGHYSTVEEGKDTTYFEALGEVIGFKIIQLSIDRIEVIAKCNQSAVESYFNIIIKEIYHRWPESQGENQQTFYDKIQKTKMESIEDNKEFSEKQSLNSSQVFVVHGRNEKARKALFTFLKSINLKPIEWSQATIMTGKGSPFIGEILETAFTKAQTVIVLLTGDDETRLKKEFQKDEDQDYEKKFWPQARPNVLFEAGMSFGSHTERTILVQLGRIKPFSDIAGRHILLMDNTLPKRQDLANRLKTAGCSVDLTGTDWHKDGDFENAIEEINNIHDYDNEKIKLLRDVIESPILQPSLTESFEDLKEMFHKFINEFEPIHLKMLDFLSNPEFYLRKINEKTIPPSYRRSLPDIWEKIDKKNKTNVPTKKIINDLYIRELIKQENFDVFVDKLTTERGDKFLSFIKTFE